MSKRTRQKAGGKQEPFLSCKEAAGCGLLTGNVDDAERDRGRRHAF